MSDRTTRSPSRSRSPSPNLLKVPDWTFTKADGKADSPKTPKSPGSTGRARRESLQARTQGVEPADGKRSAPGSSPAHAAPASGAGLEARVVRPEGGPPGTSQASTAAEAAAASPLAQVEQSIGKPMAPAERLPPTSDHLTKMRDLGKRDDPHVIAAGAARFLACADTGRPGIYAALAGRTFAVTVAMIGDSGDFEKVAMMVADEHVSDEALQKFFDTVGRGRQMVGVFACDAQDALRATTAAQARGVTPNLWHVDPQGCAILLTTAGPACLGEIPGQAQRPNVYAERRAQQVRTFGDGPWPMSEQLSIKDFGSSVQAGPAEGVPADVSGHHLAPESKASAPSHRSHSRSRTPSPLRVDQPWKPVLKATAEAPLDNFLPSDSNLAARVAKGVAFDKLPVGSQNGRAFVSYEPQAHKLVVSTDGKRAAYTLQLSDDESSVVSIETTFEGKPAAHVSTLEIYGVLARGFGKRALVDVPPPA
jgi:hypothetical protein